MRAVRLSASNPAVRRAIAKAKAKAQATHAALDPEAPLAAQQLAAALKSTKTTKRKATPRAASVKPVPPPTYPKQCVFLPVLELRGDPSALSPPLELRAGKDALGRFKQAFFQSHGVTCYLYQGAQQEADQWQLYADFKKCVDKSTSPVVVANLLAAYFSPALRRVGQNPDIAELFDNTLAVITERNALTSAEEAVAA